MSNAWARAAQTVAVTSSRALQEKLTVMHEEKLRREIEKNRVEVELRCQSDAHIELTNMNRSLEEEKEACLAELEATKNRELAKAAESSQKALRLAVAQVEKDLGSALQRQVCADALSCQMPRL